MPLGKPQRTDTSICEVFTPGKRNRDNLPLKAIVHYACRSEHINHGPPILKLQILALMRREAPGRRFSVPR